MFQQPFQPTSNNPSIQTIQTSLSPYYQEKRNYSNEQDTGIYKQPIYLDGKKHGRSPRWENSYREVAKDPSTGYISISDITDLRTLPRQINWSNDNLEKRNFKGGRVILPEFNTVVKAPKTIVKRPTQMVYPAQSLQVKSADENIKAVLSRINPEMLTDGRVKKNSGSYTHAQHISFANDLGIPTSNKKKRDIKREIIRIAVTNGFDWAKYA